MSVGRIVDGSSGTCSSGGPVGEALLEAAIEIQIVRSSGDALAAKKDVIVDEVAGGAGFGKDFAAVVDHVAGDSSRRTKSAEAESPHASRESWLGCGERR